MVADEVVETPYVVCKTTVLTVELIGNNRHVSITSCIELHKDKMHAIARLYWIRTNVSSIAASALATKLNARMVDTNVTLLYASSNSTRSKWPNHYDSLLYQLSYVLTYLERTAGLKPATNGLECKNEHCCMDLKMVGVVGFEPTTKTL